MHRRSTDPRRRSTIPGRALRTAASSFAALLVLAAPARGQLPAPAVVGSGPFQIGGYAAVTLSRPEHPEEVERAEVSELVAAVLGWGQIVPRLSYLVELDMAKRTTETWTGREADHRLVPVRLYMEYTGSDLFRIRLGRFLTPVGQWNERHAEPLTWTPTRPLTTYRAFAKSLTGLMVAGQGTLQGHDAGYAVFWSPSSHLDGGLEEEEEESFVHALGARVAAELHPGMTVGLSLADVRRSRPREEEPAAGPSFGLPEVGLPVRDAPGGVAFDRSAVARAVRGSRRGVAEQEGDGDLDDREEDAAARMLLGADVRWADPRLELLVEGVWLPPSREAGYEGGAFAQGAVRLTGPLWAVARAETFRPVDGRVARLGYAGLTLRSGRRFVAKLGRQFSRRPSERIPDGWFLSLSALF